LESGDSLKVLIKLIDLVKEEKIIVLLEKRSVEKKGRLLYGSLEKRLGLVVDKLLLKKGDKRVREHVGLGVEIHRDSLDFLLDGVNC